MLYCREYNKLPQRITFVTSGNFAMFPWKWGYVSLGNFSITRDYEKYLICSLETALKYEWMPTNIQTTKAMTSEVGFTRVLIPTYKKEWILIGIRTCFVRQQFNPSLDWMSLKRTQTEPLCQRQRVIFLCCCCCC